MSLTTEILYGKPVSLQLRQELKNEISNLSNLGIIPGLAVVLVGEDAASQVYVRSKSRAFKKMACFSETFNLPENTSETELCLLIDELNASSKFHGILVQLPLPAHLDSKKITRRILSRKDVDGFHPLNVGLLLEGQPQFISCTPHGILKLMAYYGIKTNGKHAVIVGRSNIVGKPMFALLAEKMEYGNSTVTICHTGTVDLSRYTSMADILIVASGMPGLITGNMISEGVHIIDVGINRIKDNSEKGYRLVGDVDYESILGIAGSITPVPGGVGPLTITMLLYNTVLAAKNIRP
jgi:methylenetetrahydrofolate dehydrogenase (NADP+)/methenyltetrahydrofolate cyclohydrolase